MSKFLIDEYPLMVIPSLAVEVGLNEAIILQQVHYWIGKSDKEYDGYRWTYNTYEGWQEQFPFWSVSTIRRSITNLEKEDYLITGNYNKMKADKTKWYTINYLKLQGVNSPSVQIEQSISSKWTDPSVQNEQSNTLDLPETSSDIDILFNLWNQQEIIKHKKMNQMMKSHTNARLKDYTIDELKQAIINYKTVLSGTEYYWTHKWTYQEFMKPNNVVRFLDEADPKRNFIQSSFKSKEESKPTTPSQRMVSSEELLF